MNVLFLDIDGVLTSRKSHSMLFECNPKDYKLSDECLDYLDKIIDRTHCKIVLSTSWRNYPDNHSFECYTNTNIRYHSLLPYVRQMYRDQIIGDALHKSGSNKYDDISATIIKLLNERDIDRVAILDDSFSDDLELFNHAGTDDVYWFRTDPNYGLDEEICEKVISYFKDKPIW